MSKPPDDDKSQDNLLRIESPSFSLELEGEPAFIMQSYDMIREDILERLIKVLRDNRNADAQPASTPTPQATTPPTPSPRPQLRGPRTDRPSIRGIKARMANHRRDDKPDTTRDGQPSGFAQTQAMFVAAPDQPSQDAKSASPGNTLAMIAPGAVKAQANKRPQRQTPSRAKVPPSLPKTRGRRAATPASPQHRAKPSPADYVWVYLTHDIYNKVYVCDIGTFQNSPLAAFLDGRHVAKVYFENTPLEPFNELIGHGKTLWSELTKKGRSKLKTDS